MEQEFIIRYNELATRLKNADKYLDDPYITTKEKDKPKIWSGYNDIIRGMSLMQIEYREAFGCEMSIKEKELGFI